MWAWLCGRETDADVARALTTLRTLEQNFVRKCEQIERNLQDPERAILEIRNAVAARPERHLTDVERVHLQEQLHRRRVFLLRLERFSTLAAEINQRVAAIEDTVALSDAVSAMRLTHHVTQHHRRIMSDYETLIVKIEDEQKALAYMTRAFQTLGPRPDVPVLLDELDALISRDDIVPSPDAYRPLGQSMERTTRRRALNEL